MIILNIIPQNNCITPRTTVRTDSVTLIYHSQTGEWSQFIRGPLIHFSVLARPQLHTHKQTGSLRCHWLRYRSCPASQTVTCNLTWRKSTSELQRDLNKAFYPVIHHKTSRVLQSLMLYQYMNVNLTTFHFALSEYVQQVVTIQWLRFCSEAEGSGDREEKSTWCRRAPAT